MDAKTGTADGLLCWSDCESSIENMIAHFLVTLAVNIITALCAEILQDIKETSMTDCVATKIPSTVVDNAIEDQS